MGHFANGIPTRDETWRLLCEWTQSPGLRGHALAVEAAMRFYARKFRQPVDLWGLVGLIHDFDYERYPEAPDHPAKGAEELRRLGVDEVIVRAMLSHADYSGVPRESFMEKTLYSVDETCGLVVATALVMPNRKLSEVTTDSVLKKFKSKGFARKVNRDDIVRGASDLGIPLDEHVSNVISALREASSSLGL